jgi:hypothetical protein
MSSAARAQSEQAMRPRASSGRWVHPGAIGWHRLTVRIPPAASRPPSRANTRLDFSAPHGPVCIQVQKTSCRALASNCNPHRILAVSLRATQKIFLIPVLCPLDESVGRTVALR